MHKIEDIAELIFSAFKPCNTIDDKICIRNLILEIDNITEDNPGLVLYKAKNVVKPSFYVNFERNYSGFCIGYSSIYKVKQETRELMQELSKQTHFCIGLFSTVYLLAEKYNLVDKVSYSTRARGTALITYNMLEISAKDITEQSEFHAVELLLKHFNKLRQGCNKKHNSSILVDYYATLSEIKINNEVYLVMRLNDLNLTKVLNNNIPESLEQQILAKYKLIHSF